MMEYDSNNYKLMGLTEKQKEKLKWDLKAFCRNFDKGITIQKYNKYYYIFNGIVPDDDIYDEMWIFSCDSLDVINGWLYGMVQANHGYMNLFKKESGK